MKNKLLKSNNAITLIALVITIIVLLLLAGISISMLSGQDGILIKASDAKESTRNTEDYEGVVLAAQTALADGLGKVDLANEGALEKSLGTEYTYLGEGLVKKDEKYYRIYEDGTVTKGGVRVGDIVTYTPPSVTDAKWSAEYSGLKDSGTTTDAVLDNTLDITNENSFKVTSWRVLSIEDGKVNLISENPTIGKVFLGNANGYNNGVKLLNDSCDILYGDEAKGIEGRSIKIEDIENLLTEEGKKSKYSYSSSVKYDTQENSAYTEYNHYPTIYVNEKLSVINGVKKEHGLGVSEQNEYYTGSAEPPNEEGITKSIQPYQTYWYKNAEEMKKYLGATEDVTTSINYELIMPKQNSTTYWVASRCICTFEYFCSFRMCRVYLGDMDAWTMYSQNINSNNNTLALRPIVSLNSDLLVRNVAGDGTVTWSVR